YLGHAVSASAYGAGSAFIVILMYVYYSSLILFFGAEFTKALLRVKGVKIELSRYAMAVTNDQRSEQGLAREPAEPPPLKPAGAQAMSSGFGAHGVTQPTMITTHENEKKQDTPVIPHGLAPLQRIRSEPWSFVGLALTVGVAAGVLLRFKTVRKV